MHIQTIQSFGQGLVSLVILREVIRLRFFVPHVDIDVEYSRSRQVDGIACSLGIEMIQQPVNIVHIVAFRDIKHRLTIACEIEVASNLQWTVNINSGVALNRQVIRGNNRTDPHIAVQEINRSSRFNRYIPVDVLHGINRHGMESFHRRHCSGWIVEIVSINRRHRSFFGNTPDGCCSPILSRYQLAQDFKVCRPRPLHCYAASVGIFPCRLQQTGNQSIANTGIKRHGGSVKARPVRDGQR